jgi:selenide,water dikinase
VKVRRKRLVLVGGGHAHLEVLRRFGEDPDPALDLTLVSLGELHHYSGMVPGYLSGIYDEDDLSVPLPPLAERAGGRFVRARVTAIDPASRRLALERGETSEALRYDLVSFDVGSLAAGQERPDVARHALAVKPIGRARELRAALLELADREPPARVVVVGGGAAGVEVAFAATRVLDDLGTGRRVTLVEAGDRILAGHPARVRSLAARLLARRSVHVLTGRRVERVEEDRVVLTDDSGEVASDLTIWLTGPQAPPLFAVSAPDSAGSGLPLDDRGYLWVDRSLRSVGDPRVFGAGDCVTLEHAPETPKAGVYAVRQGPVLHASLRAALASPPGTPPVYEPQRGFLSLLNTCDGRAILSWEGVWPGDGTHARWAWWLKDRIDRRFVRKYR